MARDASHVTRFKQLTHVTSSPSSPQRPRVPRAAHVKCHSVDIYCVVALAGSNKTFVHGGDGVEGERPSWLGRRGVAVAAGTGQTITWSFLSVCASHRDRQDARPSVRRSLTIDSATIPPRSDFRPRRRAGSASSQYRRQPHASLRPTQRDGRPPAVPGHA